MAEPGRVELIVPPNKIGERVSSKLLTSDQLQRIKANGFFKKETQTELMIGVKETDKSILLYRINVKPETVKQVKVKLHRYTVQYCNNDGTQQMRANPNSKTKPGTRDGKVFGPYYSYAASGGMLTAEQFKAIQEDPKGILQVLKYKPPKLEEAK